MKLTKQRIPLALLSCIILVTGTWSLRHGFSMSGTEPAPSDAKSSRGPASSSGTNAAASPAPSQAPVHAISPYASKDSSVLQNGGQNEDPLRAEVERLKSCYSSRSCDFPETDPRSYELELGRELSRALRSYLSARRNDADSSSELASVGRDAMLILDAFVQEAALEIFAALPPSPENLQAIIDGLADTPEPRLISKALDEFDRYMGTPLEPDVHRYISGLIGTGAHFAGTTASEKALRYINHRSYRQYEETWKRMDPTSEAARNLGSALREFRRLQSGS